MGTCKTCRWWGDGPCGSPKLINQEALLNWASIKGTWQPVAGDSWGLDFDQVAIVTGPDFGCVHWEERKALG